MMDFHRSRDHKITMNYNLETEKRGRDGGRQSVKRPRDGMKGKKKETKRANLNERNNSYLGSSQFNRIRVARDRESVDTLARLA